MPATLRSLLDHPDFSLRALAGFASPDALDQAITWVHNSDLPDPAPWLDAGQLLLIDGLQFTDATDAAWTRDYVGRLKQRGVLGLGFATQIAHDAVPEQLIDVCDELGFPLIEVAGRTPFIAIIRYVADVTAAEQRERLEWSSEAQRAITRAALRPDGLAAVLRELERRLDCWVALYDAAGDRIDIETTIPIPAGLLDDVDAAAHDALRRGNPSGGRLQLDGSGATLQTLGRRGSLRGVLAVGTGSPLDAAESDLVSSVIGIASIALEQSRVLEEAQLRVRAAVLEMLLSGSMKAAGKTAQRLWGTLPEPPVRVCLVEAAQAGSSLLSQLELSADRHRGRVFFAERDRDIVIVTGAGDLPLVTTVLQKQGGFAGFSAPLAWDELDRGIAEARRARGSATASRPIVTFEKLVDEGIVAFLDAAGVHPLAHRRLEAVLASENPDHRVLLKTLEVWLEHNGAWDPASRALSIHRHTLRNRLHTIEGLLDVDLARFADRAELWTALQFVDYPGKAGAAPGGR